MEDEKAYSFPVPGRNRVPEPVRLRQYRGRPECGALSPSRKNGHKNAVNLHC